MTGQTAGLIRARHLQKKKKTHRKSMFSLWIRTEDGAGKRGCGSVIIIIDSYVCFQDLVWSINDQKMVQNVSQNVMRTKC